MTTQPFDQEHTPVHDPVTNPITDLQNKLRRTQNRQASLAIEARDLARRHGEIRDELAQLDTVATTTRALLRLADIAVTNANTATDKPAKPAKKTKP